MKNKKTVIALCIVIVGLCYLLVSGLNDPAPDIALASGESGAVVSSIAEVSGQNLDRDPHESSFLFVDHLTGRDIPTSLVSWFSTTGNGSETVAAVEAPIAEIVSGVGHWVLTGYGEPMTFSVDSTHYKDLEFHLPVSADLSIKVFDKTSGGAIPGVVCQVGYIDQTQYQKCTGMGALGVEMAFSSIGTPAYFLRVYEKEYAPVAWSDCIEDQGGHFKENLSDTTFVGVRVFHKSYGQRFIVTELRRGKNIEIEIPMLARPRIVGVLKDSLGRALANRSIDVVVDLGQDADDIGETDAGFAMVVAGESGSWHRGARTTVKTGKYGQFGMVMPKGIQFAAEYKGNDSYGFAMSEEFSFMPVGDIFLEVIAADFSEGYEVHVLRDDNLPVQGLYVRPRIADDFPWFRQFPGVPVDESGVAHLPMIVEGQEKVRLIVQTSWDWTDAKVLAKTPLIVLPSPPFRFLIHLENN